jgi:hypothetical protein
VHIEHLGCFVQGDLVRRGTVDKHFLGNHALTLEEFWAQCFT